MMIYFIISIYIATFLTQGAIATGDNGIKRGVYPFMAIIYYSDSGILDDMGLRFQRAGILIHESWLITSSIDGKESKELGFPKKTLIARLGAIHLEPKFSFNEDEDEQEREIIQVVKAANYKKSPWWKTDVNLLKTLLPFNVTQAVATTTFHARSSTGSKTCMILVYSKLVNGNDEKLLMKLDVELLPSTKEECGENFDNNTMMCAAPGEEIKTIFQDNFCQGNRGGPLLCDGDVVGLQTYVDDCKQPFLYQILSPLETFISCGMQDLCDQVNCLNICTSVYKDDYPASSTKKTATHSVSSYFLDQEGKNVTSRPSYARAVDEEFMASPSLTTVAEVTTSLPSLARSGSTWQFPSSDNVSISGIPIPAYASTGSDPTAMDDVASVSVYSSMDPGGDQNAESGSEATAEQAMEPSQDIINEISPEPPSDFNENNISNSNDTMIQEEGTSNNINITKPEDQEDGHVMKIIETRRKTHHREDNKERRGKVEAQLKVPLSAPTPKASGAKRLFALPGLILSVVFISSI